MNILVVGSGAGSWTIRGLQLGAAIGARVLSVPTGADWVWADVVVLVKRSGRHWAETARRYGVPIVWDALDFWAQPDDNGLTETEAGWRMMAELLEIQPAVTIGATETMADSAHGVYLPHHSRPGLVPTPARTSVEVIGYEGDARYLGHWSEAIATACQARGWRCVINPPSLADVDIIVAFRDGPWDGWMPRQWKSGVKIVNAIAAGRPILTQDSAAWRELQPHGGVLEHPRDLPDAFEHWASHIRRAAVVNPERASHYSLAAIAQRYRRVIASVVRQGVTV